MNRVLALQAIDATPASFEDGCSSNSGDFCSSCSFFCE
jgi:hypothetical protein